MNWIVVFRGKAFGAAMRELLADASACAAEDCDPVPLEPDEISVEVEGPDDLNRRLQGKALVSGVYPNSEMTLY